MYALPPRRWISLILVKLGPAHTVVRLVNPVYGMDLFIVKVTVFIHGL